MLYLAYGFIGVGLVLVITGLFLPDKEKGKTREGKENLTPADRANLLAEGKKEIDGIFQDRAEDAIEKVDEQLSRISNEKIISVSEYSDQVLEKINQNHQEVVFLYNMLNAKEEEMKQMMSKMKTMPKDTPGEKQAEKLSRRAASLSEEQAEKLSRRAASLPTEQEERAPAPEKQAGNEDFEMLRGLIYNEKKEPEKEPEYTVPPRRMPDFEENSIPKQVLEMYKSGMDIVEISRTLNKGRGEVQLIIDLYGRR